VNCNNTVLFTSERYLSDYRERKVTVEIEASYELEEFVKFEILYEHVMTYPKWVEKCYVERMRQILDDPVEFGKAVLERKKSDHCIHNAFEL
jgi:hypothetical protein